MNTKSKLMAASFILLACMSASVVAQKVVPVAPFTSVKLDGGGRITLRYGATQRVTMLTGDQEYTQITTDGDRLVINNCRLKCPRGYKSEIEVVTPVVKGISVSNGGLIQSRGTFPSQANLSVAVDNGGMIDIRLITVNNVTAAVRDGGRILVKPQTDLVVSIADGGAVTYWGTPHVTSAIRRGGVVEKGDPADADKPVTEIGHSLPRLPDVPPVPPIKRRGQFWE